MAFLMVMTTVIIKEIVMVTKTEIISVFSKVITTVITKEMTMVTGMVII